MGLLDDGRLIAFVPTTDLARARAFYAETLGLPVAEESQFACVLDANGTMLRLTPVRRLSRVRYTVLGWGVDDIAVTAGRLAAAGVAFVRYRGMEVDDAGVWTAPGGDRVAWFEDPDGNLLSLTQFVR
ncbi:MAG TPA: VOC family protein [Candidatus Saccharimonadales bacterium]|nr:VOC family protein [Candidatus Saccharimonadales bacterium]